jgi:hypothetical protein
MGERDTRQEFARGIIIHVSEVIKRTAVTMVGVSTEADIGHHHEIGEGAFKQRDCALDCALRVKGARASRILRAFGLAKEQDAADTLLRRQVRRRAAVHPYSAGYWPGMAEIASRRFSSLDNKERPDKL